MSSDTPILLKSIDGGLARLTINRPHRLNTLSKVLMSELREAFRDLADNPEVHLIHLTATGEKAFCAGADLKEPGRHEYDGLDDYLEGQPAVFDMMRRCPQIIISEVNGWAIGGGMLLSLFSDLAYASRSAKFQLPQVKLGIMSPYGSTVRLARFIGHGRAMEMSLLGTTMHADEAYQAGLIQGLCETPTELHDYVEDKLQELLSLPKNSLMLTKNALSTGWEMSAESAANADRFRDFALKQTPEMKQLHKS